MAGLLWDAAIGSRCSRWRCARVVWWWRLLLRFTGPGPGSVPGVKREEDKHTEPVTVEQIGAALAALGLTVANSYLNGDAPGGPYFTPVDSRVPVC